MSNMLFEVAQNVLNAFPNRRIIIWGCGAGGYFIKYALKVLGAEIDYFVDSKSSLHNKTMFGNLIKNPYDLLLENKEEVIVLSSVLCRDETDEQLQVMGFEENINYSNIDNFLTCKRFTTFDPLLGYTRIDDLAGFKVFGDPDISEIKIAVLGGSTSDFSLSLIDSWPKMLYDTLEAEGYSAVVYNGAIGGYSSTNEMKKMIRDVTVLKPDIVLVMSGVNDIDWVITDKNQPFYTTYFTENMEHIFNDEFKLMGAVKRCGETKLSFGLDEKLTDYENWYKNIKIIHAIATEFKIKHKVFLQPTMSYGRYKGSDLEQRWLRCISEDRDIQPATQKYLTKAKSFYEGALKLSKNDDYIVNITDLFDEMSDMYLDLIHYDIKGNQILANRVYEEIKDFLFVDCLSD